MNLKKLGWIFQDERNVTLTPLRIRFDEGLTLETTAFESLYGGQFILSAQLIKPNIL